jgi:heterodisulfide reductase subunit B
MNYLYYPGCSLEGTAREYDIATRAMMTALGVTLTEIEDWTCCGASAAHAVSHLLTYALPARNLAIAEKMEVSDEILVPCSACYLNLRQATEERSENLLKDINAVLDEDGLEWQGSGKVRHLLDVMSTDIGPAMVREHVEMALSGLTIAPYYGCQCLRPYAVFDDPEKPESMNGLIAATGASVFDWDMGAKCCGASHMNTQIEVGTALVAALLKAAQGADAIVTVCPMCQMNLEAYQERVSKFSGENLAITVLYLPQLIGLALGLSEKALGLEYNLAVTGHFRKKLYPGVERRAAATGSG